MTTVRRGYDRRVRRGDRVVNGQVVEAQRLPADEREVLEALHEERYPHDAPLATIERLAERGWIRSLPRPNKLPVLALTTDGRRALARAS